MTNQELNQIKDVVVIHYIWWAMQRRDRWMWCAIMNGNVIDYHKKEVLINNAESKGLKWIVVRHHKKQSGLISIIKHSSNYHS